MPNAIKLRKSKYRQVAKKQLIKIFQKAQNKAAMYFSTYSNSNKNITK